MDYVLEEQAGFLLRQVNQRHTVIFAELMPDGLTPTQFSAMVKLYEIGPCSQNHLGRLTAMDAATIKGVISRLRERGFARTTPDETDKRRLLVTLTPEGEAAIETALPRAREITERTLAPLSPGERNTFLSLLKKLR
ncbi:MarR family winged helix-turn-helix transcriptional regulator [Kaustia mangrovi]|nr:MarR family transcriptional regulator [Kaustia mangrovi]